jgi:hypothetical protein
LVGRKDDGYDSRIIIPAAAAAEIIEVEVQRRRASEVAPLGSEDLGASTLVVGEEGDDIS